MLTSYLRADGNQNLGHDLVDECQVRPTNPNHFPACAFEVSLATLLGLNAVVDLIDGLPVLDAPIELDGDLQVRQCDIDEVRVAVNVDFFLCCQPIDARVQQSEEDQGLAGRLASSISVVDDPSGVPASSGVAGSILQGLVELPPCLILAVP